MAAKVVPPFRFAIVEVGVYRGAYPTLKNFAFLKSLNLKTMISLIPEAPTNDLEDFCEMEGIQHIHHMGERLHVALLSDLANEQWRSERTT